MDFRISGNSAARVSNIARPLRASDAVADGGEAGWVDFMSAEYFVIGIQSRAI